MTPAEHIDAAEGLLTQARRLDTDIDRDQASFLVNWSIAHSLIAIAVELGVPHAAAPGGAHDAG